MVLSSESTAARMGRIGKSVLFGTPLLTLDELLEKVDAVSSQDVAELARELYAPDSLSAAAIAPSEERFRSALAPVSEALAAA
jgi:predicted Zn-dependent peptidase